MGLRRDSSQVRLVTNVAGFSEVNLSKNSFSCDYTHTQCILLLVLIVQWGLNVLLPLSSPNQELFKESIISPKPPMKVSSTYDL